MDGTNHTRCYFEEKKIFTLKSRHLGDFQLLSHDKNKKKNNKNRRDKIKIKNKDKIMFRNNVQDKVIVFISCFDNCGQNNKI